MAEPNQENNLASQDEKRVGSYIIGMTGFIKGRR